MAYHTIRRNHRASPRGLGITQVYAMPVLCACHPASLWRRFLVREDSRG